MRYLDPRNDVAFRKIFGRLKTQCKSLLNSLLPLEEGAEITQIEYLDPDMWPVTPDYKNSIVDVHCTDSRGRTFVVEMQMHWVSEFMPRALLNAAKAYTEQIKRGKVFGTLQPVYSLCIINDSFLKAPEYAGEFRHVYSITHERHPELKIKGMTFVFVELPKFRSGDRSLNATARLWLRFLTEVQGREKANVAPDLAGDELIAPALRELELTSYTEEELRLYDRVQDAIMVQNCLLSGAFNDGRAEGREEGIAQGIAQGMAEGASKATLEIARNLKQIGLTAAQIASATGLTHEEAEVL